jgi:fucose permease
LLVFAVSGLAFFLGVELGSFNFVLLRIAREFTLNTGIMGILVTFQYIAITAAPVAFGWIADRIGKKTTLLIFMPVFTGGCFISASAGSVIFFVIGVFILGIGYSVCESVSSSALSDTFPGRENRYMNIMQSSFSLGAVISPLFFRWFLDQLHYSWSWVFIVSGSGFVLFYPLILLSDCHKMDSANSHEKAGSLVPVLRSSFFLALLFCMMAYVAMETGISYFIDSLLITEYQNSALSAWTISGFWFAMAFSRLFFASIKMKPRSMVLLGFLVSAFLLFILFLFKNQWVFFCAIISLGFMMGPVWPMVLSTGISAFQEKSGIVGGILYAGGGVGGIVTPLIFSAIAENAGFYAGFLLLAFIALIGFLLMKLQGRKEKRSNRQINTNRPA